MQKFCIMFIWCCHLHFAIPIWMKYIMKKMNANSLCDDNMPSKYISYEVQPNASECPCNDSRISLLFLRRHTIFPVTTFFLCDVLVLDRLLLALYFHLVCSFIFTFFFCLFESNQTMITTWNEDERTEFICVCISAWTILYFYHIIIIISSPKSIVASSSAPAWSKEYERKKMPDGMMSLRSPRT